jgi:hypothetical protein
MCSGDAACTPRWSIAFNPCCACGLDDIFVYIIQTVIKNEMPLFLFGSVKTKSDPDCGASQ